MSLPRQTALEHENREEQVFSQYDEIGSSYTVIKQLPTEQIETFNLHAAARPYLTKESRVLDLASGTGHYTRKLVSEWGAASAVGVDISLRMVETARHMTLHKSAGEGGYDYTGKVEFTVGDAKTLGRLDGDGFDLVMGSWLLNYAETEDELVDMFRTISANLNSDRGAFVGIVPNAVEAADLDEYAKRQNEEIVPKTRRPPWRYEIRYLHPLGGSEVGWKCEVGAFDEAGEKAVVEFETNHMPKEVFERAARKGGLTGDIVWWPVRPPVAENSKEGSEDDEMKFWDEYFAFGPHFSVIVVTNGEGVHETPEA